MASKGVETLAGVRDARAVSFLDLDEDVCDFFSTLFGALVFVSLD